MSEGPELSETEALAAEHALGVLSSAERRAAEQRMAEEPAFAALVEAWRERLAPMSDRLSPVAPPDRVWAAVLRALPANDNQAARGVLRFWRGKAGWNHPAHARVSALEQRRVAIERASRPGARR